MTVTARHEPPQRRVASATEGGQVDAGRIVRAASRAFSVLLVGGVAQPLVGHWLPPLGAVWLAIVAVAAFGVAGYSAPAHKRHAWAAGSAAALGSYLLVLPLVLGAAHQLAAAQLLVTGVTAVAVGAAVATLRTTRAVR